MERTARLLGKEIKPESNAQMNRLVGKNGDLALWTVVVDMKANRLLWFKEKDNSMMIGTLRHLLKVCWTEFNCEVFRPFEFLAEAGLFVDKLEQRWCLTIHINILGFVERRAFLDPFEGGKALNLETVAETSMSVCINLSDDDIFGISKCFTKFLVFWSQVLALLNDVSGNRLLNGTYSRAGGIHTTYVSTPWGVEFYHDGRLGWIE